jgi:hypothetical protein
MATKKKGKSKTTAISTEGQVEQLRRATTAKKKAKKAVKK